METNKIKKLTENSDQEKFFKSLKSGEVFTYSEAFDPQTIERIATFYGIDVLYCRPYTSEYKEYGSYTMKTMAIMPFLEALEKFVQGSKIIGYNFISGCNAKKGEGSIVMLDNGYSLVTFGGGAGGSDHNETCIMDTDNKVVAFEVNICNG